MAAWVQIHVILITLYLVPGASAGLWIKDFKWLNQQQQQPHPSSKFSCAATWLYPSFLGRGGSGMDAPAKWCF